MTALADATDPRFTDGQRAQLGRFEAAEVPAEVVEAVPHEHGRWCLTGCDTGGSEPLPPADLSRLSAPAPVTAVDLDALDKLRGALAAEVRAFIVAAVGEDMGPGMTEQAEELTARLLPIVDRIANERAAAELREARDYVYGYGVRDQVVIGYLNRRADALDPT